MDHQGIESSVCNLALQQCSDILRLQEETCNVLQEKLNRTSCHVPQEDLQALKQALQSEKMSQQQTCDMLERERERATLAEAELAILKRQLNREKKTFENAFGLLKSQALTDCSRAEDLLAKCSALESMCMQKDEELKHKDRTISQLQRQLRAVEERHRQELLEAQVHAQQDAYVARYLGSKDRRARKRQK